MVGDLRINLSLFAALLVSFAQLIAGLIARMTRLGLRDQFERIDSIEVVAASSCLGIFVLILRLTHAPPQWHFRLVHELRPALDVTLGMLDLGTRRNVLPLGIGEVVEIQTGMLVLQLFDIQEIVHDLFLADLRVKSDIYRSSECSGRLLDVRSRSYVGNEVVLTGLMDVLSFH